FGVSWIYLLWALGFESLWRIVLPIQFAELLFPRHREDPWLGKAGLALPALAFLLTSLAACVLFEGALERFYHGPAIPPPTLASLAALAVIVVLLFAALGPWSWLRSERQAPNAAPRPWVVGLVAWGLGLLWFALVLLHYGILPALPAVIPF